jgi:endonuclease YncB( thermonuclease family)
MSAIKFVTKYTSPVIVGSKNRDFGFYDGDTFYGTISLGYNLKLEDQSFRLYGINTNEVKLNAAKKIGKEHVAKGKATRDYARTLVPDGTEVMVESYKVIDNEADKEKFGRYLVICYVPIGDKVLNLDGLKLLAVDSTNPTHFCLNDLLLRDGHAEAMVY